MGMLKDEIAAYYDRRADIPAYVSGAIRFDEAPFLREVTGSVLDICCGGGRVAFYLASRGCTVTGLDFATALIGRARDAATAMGRRASEPLRFTVGDATNLPFRDASFEHVICMGSLMYQPSERERQQAVREMVRVLRPGGSLLATVSSRYYPGQYGIRWAGMLYTKLRYPSSPAGDMHVPVRPYLHHYVPAELRRLFQAAGMDVEAEPSRRALGDTGLRGWFSDQVVVRGTRPAAS